MSEPLARVKITENCRDIHGIEKAFDVACEELKKAYLIFATSKSFKSKVFKIELH